MKVPYILVALVLAVGAALLPGGAVRSQKASNSKTTIRFASLAPPGSSFVKVLRAWNRTLQKDTDGRVELRVFSGSGEGDEREFIRKIKAGKLDAAGVATGGLGMIARPTLVLSAPGLITEYAELERVQGKLDPTFKKMLADQGFALLAWGVAGKQRIFSTKAFSSPSDLKGAEAWAGLDSPVMDAYWRALGCKPLSLATSGVRAALEKKQIAVVPGSAMSTVAFQWYTSLGYVTKQDLSIIVGASIISEKKLAELQPSDREALFDSAARASRALDKIVKKDDARSYRTLLKRGLKEVDVSANQREWEAIARTTREALIGKVYSKSLLQDVEKAVEGG